MKISLAIIVLLLNWVCSTHQNKICEDIRDGNGDNYPIEQINKCAEDEVTRQNKQLAEVLCPRWDCPPNKCILGYAKDAYGCLTCDCVSKGKEELYEGDIVVTNDVRIHLQHNVISAERTRTKRGAAKEIKMWNIYKSGDYYAVPYLIDGSAGGARSVIQIAIREFEQKTCIKLIPRTTQPYYIKFTTGRGCSSPVGRTGRGGVNEVSLDRGCWRLGTVIHEILHSLGFWHEQSRPDRDKYVTIHWNNIRSGFSFNFNKLSTNRIDSRGSDYDIGSVMHYSSGAFSTNGRSTITDKDGNRLKTQRNGFAASDIFQLNAMYGCKNTGTGGTSSTTTAATTTTKPLTGCKNKNLYCNYWKGRGYCKHSFVNYMKKNCALSCGLCNNNGCKNKNLYCNYWKGRGYCKHSFVNYMKKNCALSCGLCYNNGK